MASKYTRLALDKDEILGITEIKVPICYFRIIDIFQDCFYGFRLPNKLNEI